MKVINANKKHGLPGDETLFTLRDPEQLYTHDEIVAILEKANAAGFSLEKNSPLEKLTIAEVDLLVNRKRKIIGKKEVANLRKAIAVLGKARLRDTYADRMLRVDLYRALASVSGE